MKKIKIRVFSAVICSLIIAASFTGCKKAAKEAVVTPNGKAAPTTIKMIVRLPTTYVIQDNPVLKLVEQKTNVKLDIEAPPLSDYDDRVNIVMASGDMPDLILFTAFNGKYDKYAQDGLLVPLDGYLKNAPNITKLSQPEQLDQGRVGDKLYSIPRPHEAGTFMAVYRKDWLDNLGLQAPKTIDDFEKVAVAISTKDPDKDGKNDTYGISLTPGFETDPLFDGVFGLRASLIPNADGKVTIPEGQDGYIKELDFFRKLYAEKAIDPEWYLNKTYGASDKFNQGKIGIHFKYVKPLNTTTTFNKDLLKAFPTAKIDYILPLQNSQGKSAIDLSPSTWGGFAITKSAKDPKKIMDFLNWSFSDEGIETWNGGVKGVTYQSYDQKTSTLEVPPAMVNDATKYVSSYMSFITSVKGKRLTTSGSNDADRALVEKATNDYYKNVQMTDYPSLTIVPGYNEANLKLTDIVNTKNEYVSKYIIGKITKDEFVKFINEKYIPANKDVIDSLQKYYDTKIKK